MSKAVKGKLNDVQERELKALSGYLMLAVSIVIFILAAALIVAGFKFGIDDAVLPAIILIAAGCLVVILFCILLAGFHVVNPNEALVLTLFGNYYGTIKKPGFYFTNPFASSANPVKGKSGRGKKVSLKTMTLNNDKQKVNDVLGNPIIIGAVVIWRVVDPTKAVFNVENYRNYLSIQCDSTIRNIARLYPYDTIEEDESDKDEKTLRGSSQEIADSMRTELQERVEAAGLEIMDVRITHLSYAEEIAAAMLQRQQAVAVIAARKKIVEGAVSMVQMAIDQLSEEEIVVLDEERKAAMVSNLLVVLCGNKDAQPIVNSGSIY